MHNFLALAAAREVQREEHPTVHFIYWPHQSLWPCEQRIFKILAKTGCPPKLLSMIQSFNTEVKGNVQYNDPSSEAFDIHNGVKQGCILAPSLFRIFFAVVLRRFWIIDLRNLPAHKFRLETTQPLPTESKDQSMWGSYQRHSLPIMLHWHPTLRNNCKASWVAFHKPMKTSVLPSAWRK